MLGDFNFVDQGEKALFPLADFRLTADCCSRFVFESAAAAPVIWFGDVAADLFSSSSLSETRRCIPKVMPSRWVKC